ncbi:MAG: hypothetical protein V1787_04625 [Candidatus Micrarchaeota archaeon]
MTDTAKRALGEAENWLVSAKHGLVEAQEEETAANVSCAQSIHSIIRANDALSLKFYGHKPTRHDDAAVVFSKLVKEGKLPAHSARFKELVADAMRDKSGADYGKETFSHEKAEEYAQHAEEFIAMVKDVLKL